jgi:hypothetical protein
MATSTAAGKVVYNITITIDSSIPSTDTILCTGHASVLDFSAATFTAYGSYNETATVTANRSGNTATCSVTVPYSWALMTMSTDTVSLEYEISVIGSFTATTGIKARYQDTVVGSVSVPLNGATTTKTIKAVI